MKIDGWEVEVVFGGIETQSAILEDGIATIPEDAQDVTVRLVSPDGKSGEKRFALYTGCHGENPRVVIYPSREDEYSWAKGYPDSDRAITIAFPDGALHVFPDMTSTWED